MAAALAFFGIVRQIRAVARSGFDGASESREAGPLGAADPTATVGLRSVQRHRAGVIAIDPVGIAALLQPFIAARSDLNLGRPLLARGLVAMQRFAEPN